MRHDINHRALKVSKILKSAEISFETIQWPVIRRPTDSTTSGQTDTTSGQTSTTNGQTNAQTSTTSEQTSTTSGQTSTTSGQTSTKSR